MMPRQRSKKLVSGHKDAAKPSPNLQAREELSESEYESSEIGEKDADEDELDRLVLGDSTGFLERLGQSMNVDSEGDSDVEGRAEKDLEAEVGLEGVDDADVSMKQLFRRKVN